MNQQLNQSDLLNGLYASQLRAIPVQKSEPETQIPLGSLVTIDLDKIRTGRVTNVALHPRWKDDYAFALYEITIPATFWRGQRTVWLGSGYLHVIIEH